MEWERYEIEELLPLVADLTEKYTSKESTSVSYETARQLMEAVKYCIDLNGYEEKQFLEGDWPSAREAYVHGFELLMEKVKETQEIYNEMVVDFCSYGNRNYEDTVKKAISAFFLYYDVRFAPQETVITMDYPTICPIKDACGICAIEKYVCYINYEQIFLQSFPRAYVQHVLDEYYEDYRNQFDNVCRIFLRHLLGHALFQKSLHEELSAQDLEQMEQHILSTDQVTLRALLEGLLKKLVFRFYEGAEDEKMADYFSCDLDDFVVELRNAAENHVLDKMIVGNAGITYNI